MEKNNPIKEWDFIIAETHNNKDKKNLIRREILFAMQILLSKLELKNYFSLKKVYCKN